MKVVIPVLTEKQPDLDQFNSEISDREQTALSSQQHWSEYIHTPSNNWVKAEGQSNKPECSGQLWISHGKSSGNQSLVHVSLDEWGILCLTLGCLNDLMYGRELPRWANESFSSRSVRLCMTRVIKNPSIRFISEEASEIHCYCTGKSVPLRTWLCLHRHCHVEAGKGLPQTTATKIDAHHCLKYHCMEWH